MKKNKEKKRKKKCSRNLVGLLPKLYCEKKNCIARERAGKIVLQEKGVVGLGLYCNRKKIVLRPGCVV